MNGREDFKDGNQRLLNVSFVCKLHLGVNRLHVSAVVQKIQGVFLLHLH